MQQLKIFGCLLAILATISSLHADTITYIDDVEMYINSTYWKCDMIDCPPDTFSCRVTKQKLQPDATQVRRANTCYYRNNTIGLQHTHFDSIDARENISLNIILHRSGGLRYIVSSSSPIVGGVMTSVIN